MIAVIFPKLALVGLTLVLLAVIFLIGWSILTQTKDLSIVGNRGRTSAI